MLGLGNLIINKSRIYWSICFDMLKISRGNLAEVAKKIYDSDIATGWLYYYSPEERHKGLAKYEAKDNDLQFTEDNFMLNSKTFLEVAKLTDFEVLDEEYLEAQSFIRLTLLPFRVRFPGLEKAVSAAVTFALTKWNVGCLNIAVVFNEELSPKQLAYLQTIPKLEENILAADLPLELIEEVAKINTELQPLVEKRKAKGKKAVRFKEISFGQLAWYYMAVLINLAHNRKYHSFDSITKKQRYETYIVLPLTIIEETTPSYKSSLDLVKDYPREVYQIIEQNYNLELDDIAEQSLDKLFIDVITDRNDIWNNINVGTCLHIVTTRTKEIAIKEQETSGNDVPNSYYYRELMKPYVELEVVQTQRFILFLLEHLLSSKDIADMSPKELSLLKESVSKSLEVFHGIRIAGNSTSKERIDKAKETLLVYDIYDAIDQKLMFIESAVEEYQTSLKDFTQAILGVILGVVPSILIVIPSDTKEMAYIKAGLSAVLSGLLTYLARLAAKYVWKKKRQYESYL